MGLTRGVMKHPASSHAESPHGFKIPSDLGGSSSILPAIPLTSRRIQMNSSTSNATASPITKPMVP